MSGSLDTKGSSHRWHTNRTRSLRHECPLGAGLTEALTQGPHRNGSTMNSSAEGTCAHEPMPCVFLGETGVLKGQADHMHTIRGQNQVSVNGGSQETAITGRPSVLTVNLGARFCPPGLHWRITKLESWPEFQTTVTLPRHPPKWDSFAQPHMGAKWGQHVLPIPVDSCSGWLFLRANCGQPQPITLPFLRW